MDSSRAWYGYSLGPDPDYSIYDQILTRYQILKQNGSVQLRLLTFEGFPAALYLSARDSRDCDKLLSLGNWRLCSLPTPRQYFPLTVL
jgi:hypothetical protein